MGAMDQHEPAGGAAWMSGVDRDEGKGSHAKAVGPEGMAGPWARVQPAHGLWLAEREVDASSIPTLTAAK